MYCYEIEICPMLHALGKIRLFAVNEFVKQSFIWFKSNFNERGSFVLLHH